MDELVISVSTCRATGVLVASWDDPRGCGGLTTQADKLSDLERNIREAIAVHFDPDELSKQVRLHFKDDPVLAAASNYHAMFPVPMSFGHWSRSGSPFCAKSVHM